MVLVWRISSSSDQWLSSSIRYFETYLSVRSSVGFGCRVDNHGGFAVERCVIFNALNDGWSYNRLAPPPLTHTRKDRGKKAGNASREEDVLISAEQTHG